MTLQIAGVSLKAFAQRYLREVLATKRKDMKPIERLLERAVAPGLGFRAVHAVTPEEVQKLIFGLRDHDAPSTAEKVRSLLDRIFKYAIVCGVAERNPVARTPKEFVYTRRSRTRALNENELKIFLTKIQDARLGWRYGAMLELLLLTLARKSELLLARWRDVNFAAATWEVPEENSKTGKAHIVYLSKRALEIFRVLGNAAMPEGSGSGPRGANLNGEWFVFPHQDSRTQPMAPTTLNHAMKRLQWGMPAFVPHDLRRTASTLLNEKGYNADVIEKAMNHAVRNQVRGVYNRAQYAAERRRMLEEWAVWLEGLKDAG
jgi:integrase